MYKKTMKSQEVYDKLKISRQYLSRLVKEGRIERLGRGRYSADDVEKCWKTQNGIFDMPDSERETILNAQEQVSEKQVGADRQRSLYERYLKPILDTVSYSDLERVSLYTNYDIMRLIEQTKWKYLDRLETYIIAGVVCREHRLDLRSLDGLLERLAYPTLMFGDKEKRVIDLVVTNFNTVLDSVEELVHMFDTATQYYMKAKEGTFRIKLLDETHVSKSDVKIHNDKRDIYVKNAKQLNTSVLGTSVIGADYTYSIDNGFVYTPDEQQPDRLITVDLTDISLPKTQRNIADRIIDYYGIDILRYIAVHAYSCSNSVISIWLDGGGSGKDFLTDLITYPISKNVVNEPNLSFANAGATSANPARAQRIFDGSRLVVLEEQTLKTFKNLWDVFIKSYVGQDGSNRIGKLSLGAQYIPVFCSLIMHMNPDENAYEYFNNGQRNFTRRTHLIDLTRGGAHNITKDWDLKNLTPRHSTLHQRTIRMNDLDYIWGLASSESKMSVSKYILNEIFKDIDPKHYVLEIPESYKYQPRETKTADDILEVLNAEE